MKCEEERREKIGKCQKGRERESGERGSKRERAEMNVITTFSFHSL